MYILERILTFVFINKLLKLIHLLSKQLVILMVGN